MSQLETLESMMKRSPDYLPPEMRNGGALWTTVGGIATAAFFALGMQPSIEQDPAALHIAAAGQEIAVTSADQQDDIEMLVERVREASQCDMGSDFDERAQELGVAIANEACLREAEGARINVYENTPSYDDLAGEATDSLATGEIVKVNSETVERGVFVQNGDGSTSQWWIEAQPDSGWVSVAHLSGIDPHDPLNELG